MSRKLNVEELESRVAPSVGLATFLSNLMKSDSALAATIGQYVDANGNVNTAGAAGAWNSAGLGSQVSPISSNFTVSDKNIISDKTAQRIMSLLGK
jgi:hypothetical protein